MLKVDLIEVKVSGQKSILRVELTTLLFALKERKVFTEEELKEAFDDALNVKPEDVVAAGNDFNEFLDSMIQLLHEMKDKEN